MNRTPRFVAGLALAATVACTAQAASVHLADIVAAPTAVMDFEDASDLFNGAIGHTNNGISIQQISGDAGNDIWSASGLGNGRSWYPDAGDNGWTRIRRLGGANFEALSVFGGSGWFTPPQSLYFELADDAVVVLSGTLAATFSGSWFGFAGGDFDEVRLRASQGQVTGLFDCPSGGAGGANNNCNFAWVDNIHVGAAVLPLPSTAWLALMALLVAATTTRRRGRLAGTGAATFTLVAVVLTFTPMPTLSADAGSADTGSADGAHRHEVRKPFSAQATAERVALTLRTGRSSGAPVELVNPPTQTAGDPMAWDDLRRTLDSLDRWLAAYEGKPPREPAFARLARVSQQAANKAHREMVQVHTDFAAGLRELEKAVRLMTAARDAVRRDSQEAAWATQVMKEFTAAGARLATDGLQRARAGGVDNQRLNAAAHTYQDGLALMLRGNYVQAFGRFGPSITVGGIPVFNLDRFEKNLNDAFGPQTVGYQYAIARDGALVRSSVFGTTGLARTNADPPNTSQVATKEMNLASISKTITATVLLRLLDERNVSVDSPIAPWLPANWALGAGIGPVPAIPAPLSFRDLLTHRSGLNGNQNGAYRFADLQNYAAAGIAQGNKVIFTYQNANFAMFRVVIPYLRFGANGVNQIASLVPFAPFDEVIAGLYIETVREYAFAPTGFVQGGCVASDPTPTLSYPFPSNGQPGIQPGDWITRCGSGGWYLSSVELLGVMATRRFTNLILAPASRQLMDLNYLGWLDPNNNYSWSTGLYGNYRNHGGDLTVSGPLGACYMEFFNGVQVAMNANSASGNYLGNGSHQCAVLKWAFENAFIAP